MAIKKDELKSRITAEMQDRGFSPSDENMKQYIFRMPPKDHILLKQHFKNKGISVSAGLRLIIYEYMDSEELR
jgi:hypothetical protein